MQIQIRYADTQEQKSLKQQTQAARQFRSAEYEFATQAWRQNQLAFPGRTASSDAGNSNEFEQYLGTTSGVPIQAQRWAQSAMRQMPGRSPLGGLPYTGSSQQTPIVQINVATSNEGTQANAGSETEADTKPVVVSPVTVQSNTPVDSAVTSERD